MSELLRSVIRRCTRLLRRCRRQAYRRYLTRRYGSRLLLDPTSVVDARVELHPGARLSVGPGACVEHTLQIWGTVSVEIGASCTVRMQTRIYGTGTVRVGARTLLNATKINCLQSVDIGEDCLIGAALVTDTDFHNVSPRLRRSTPQPDVTEPVSIGHNVWVGYGCIVLKGVTIGRDTVLAAGTVAHRSLPPGAVVAGNPAAVVRVFGPDELTGAAATAPDTSDRRSPILQQTHVP